MLKTTSHGNYIPYFLGCNQALERQRQDASWTVLETLELSPCMDHTCRIYKIKDTGKIIEIYSKVDNWTPGA